ncbi:MULTISPECIES: DUF2178 domain-containing protein [Aliiglaciecola]|uniref:DUF2178 domain-containing protein n=1 Tax=Aliiglaciecola TaxID=1406885 RepID=UPI001C097E39|nr:MULTISPECIES: DUF2178 domain-containing protein [Aliiglaciecola]MBU2878800.1 DUF2178 domain-containing protein [Aliiglaciecola lipolytica]MDO6711302.1 DUF2178 domain-containing protein [Aliiglaciecola sp. 2_MG-2023]MDO6752249.1 DUF2178 domain-containing protein [Aliiglaciecola sp. 1_MG-2023]
MNSIKNDSQNIKQRGKSATKQLFVWTSCWVLSLALVAFGPKFFWDYATTFTLIAIFINLGFGFKMIIANKQHLICMDEMQRKIQLEAMAISLGVSMVFGAMYGLLEAVRLISHSPNPSNILFVMGISYGIAVAIGYRRYM